MNRSKRGEGPNGEAGSPKFDSGQLLKKYCWTPIVEFKGESVGQRGKKVI